MSISLITQGNFGASWELFSAKRSKKDFRNRYGFKGSKSFMKKHASSLQNLTGIYCNGEKSEEKKKFYSDVNLYQNPPKDPEQSKGGEYPSYKQFVEGICELDKKEEEIKDHDQESTIEQIIKEEENHEFVEDYFTLEETEETVEENTDVNTDDVSNEEKHFEKEAEDSEQDGKGYSDLEQTEDSEQD